MKKMVVKIWAKVALGFAIVLTLLFIVSGVGTISLMDADSNFKLYRSMARQNNVDGPPMAGKMQLRLHQMFIYMDFSVNRSPPPPSLIPFCGQWVIQLQGNREFMSAMNRLLLI